MSDNDFAIKVENVFKVFRLGAKEEKADSLAVSLFGAFKNPIANYRKYRSLYSFDDIDFDNPDNPSNDPNVLWALRGVSFTVRPGEVVGVIGTNGAGKSTLLKTLSRISPPSRGQIQIRGRVSSLLEVGTGFHPELTGRENVYLNGTILGMRKKEVDAKFDEIVEFSGCERFLDTPVKRYSSGMRVRLAFAVAAHLEPEILIIDEVLAVGDAAFQRKCLNKMEDVGQAGRTVLFVSHSMPAVLRLCPRSILLNQGRVIADGESQHVVHEYLHTGMGTASHRVWPEADKRPGDEIVRLDSIRVINSARETVSTVPISESVGLEMTYEVLDDGQELMPSFYVHNQDGLNLFSTLDVQSGWRKKKRPVGKYTSTVWIPGNLLPDGTFFVQTAIVTPAPFQKRVHEKDVVVFQVVDESEGGGARGDWGGAIPGVMRPLLEWNTDYQR